MGKQLRKILFCGLLWQGLCSGVLFGQQTIQLTGTISAADQGPLVNANILAFPTEAEQQTRFAIADQKGFYRLKLAKDVVYDIAITYLGYQKFTFKHNAQKDELKNIVLAPKTNELEEVVLAYEVPIVVKEDTITYQTDAFVNGKERKLREVLKKLPGIAVDREGNVTAQGKKVTKVLVEDKIFFTGNSKLAVNNIPADAVDQVQVLDNYNSVGFLKGLQDSDDLALNIKLKEDKKQFAFGDLEVAAGPEERYLLHPNLFYYSTNTNVNFIADINNVGVKSFTFSDYMEFNGGFGKLLSDVGGYLKLAKDNFAQFLNNSDFTANTNRFAAFNLRQALSRKTDVNSFIIANDSDTETAQATLNTYNSPTETFNEGRSRKNSLDNFFVLGKLTLDYEPSKNADLSANSFVKLSKNKNQGRLLTQSPEQNNFFNTTNNADAAELTQNVTYSKRFSKAQTISVDATLSYKEQNGQNRWQTDQSFLANVLPLQPNNPIRVAQIKDSKTTSVDAAIKDYWVLNNYNHLYTTLGTSLKLADYTTQETQELDNGTLNNFAANGFGNNLDYHFNDTFLGLEYKFLTGIFTVKSGLFYHAYWFNNEQAAGRVKNSTQLVLPEIKVEAAFNSSEKLHFRYRQWPSFAETNRLATNLTLQTFNTVVRGNANLQNERVHQYALSYYKFSLFRGFNFNTGIQYRRKSQSIKNTTVLEGINQFVGYTMFNAPENAINAYLDYSKKLGSVKLAVATNADYQEFFQLVNGEATKNLSRQLEVTPKLETLFNKGPNVSLGYTHNPSLFTTDTGRSQFTNNALFATLDYNFLKDFTLKADYRHTNYQNKAQNLNNSFDQGNAAIYYQKEDSPWGFEVSATNIFNVGAKRSNSFTDFLVSDQTIFVMPRILLFKVGYKL